MTSSTSQITIDIKANTAKERDFFAEIISLFASENFSHLVQEGFIIKNIHVTEPIEKDGRFRQSVILEIQTEWKETCD